MTANQDMLPCPFCGSEAYYRHIDAGADRKYYRVHCVKCDARIGHPYIGKEDALSTWNTRADLSATAQDEFMYVSSADLFEDDAPPITASQGDE